MRPLTACTAALLVLIAAVGLRADTIVLAPVDDRWGEDSNLDGIFDMVSPGTETGLFVWTPFAPSWLRRAAFEFDLDQLLSVLDAGGTLDSAVFRVYRTSVSGNPSSSLLWFHGYAGDGVVEPADLGVDNPIAGPLLAWDPAYEMDVTAFTQSLADASATHAGFTAEGDKVQMLLQSKEGLWPEDRQPQLILTVTPIPEPSVLLLLGSGVAGLALCGWRRLRRAG